jgi:uncharacterized membrane protein
MENEQLDNQPQEPEIPAIPKRPDLYQIDTRGQLSLKGKGWKSYIHKPQSKDLPPMPPAAKRKIGSISPGARELIRGGYRIPLLDTLRGFAAVLMLFYTLFGMFYDFGLFAGTGFGNVVSIMMGHEENDYWIYMYQCLFVVISGMSINFSRNPRRRALVYAVGAVVVTALSAIVGGGVIWFGYLHFLAVASLLYGYMHRDEQMDGWFNKVGVAWMLAAFVLVVLATDSLTYDRIGIGNFTLPLFVTGFVHKGFSSPEFYGFFPWIFAYLGGVILGRYLRDGVIMENAYKFRIPGLDALGRVALPIYILHRPICYLIVWILGKIF